MARFPLALLVVLALAAPAPAAAGDGDGHATATIAGEPLEVFTYRPPGCAPEALVLVFHGLARNADRYRDHARPLADRLCLFVASPLFDSARYPIWRYQRGGIARKGEVWPAGEWTVGRVRELAAWARAHFGRPGMPYFLFGHSGGGQFLSRVAAFAETEAVRIVVANPSSHVRPSLDEPAPYGFGGVFAGADAEAALRRYLASPVTIYLGAEDTGPKDLLQNAAARAPGRQPARARHERLPRGGGRGEGAGLGFRLAAGDGGGRRPFGPRHAGGARGRGRVRPALGRGN